MNAFASVRSSSSVFPGGRRQLLGAVLCLVSSIPAIAQTSGLDGAPRFIQELATIIKGKGADDVRRQIIKKLGPPQRDVGSGLRIEQWDFAEGLLTFHPLSGPVFHHLKTHRVYRLIQTINPAGTCLLQSYEMTTLPDPANHGMRYWLGNLSIRQDMTYQFTDSGQHRDQRRTQAANFFLLHPSGKVEVRYEAPIASDTLLESLAEGALVVRMTFVPAEGQRRAEFFIRSSEQTRRLDFGADKTPSFLMSASWRNFW